MRNKEARAAYGYPPGNLVEDQINFVTEYVACAIVDGTSDENLKRLSISFRCRVRRTSDSDLNSGS